MKAQNNDSTRIKTIYDFHLTNSSCYNNLKSLCKDVGHRLSGSQSANNAVKWAANIMQNTNLDTVYLQQIMVPHWERGKKELVSWENIDGQSFKVNCSALGGSIGTNGVLLAEIIEITNWNQLEEYG